MGSVFLFISILSATLYKDCFALYYDPAIENISMSLSPKDTFGRSNFPESRLIPIITLNGPFNKNQNAKLTAEVTKLQTDVNTLQKQMNEAQTKFNNAKPQIQEILLFNKKLQAIKRRMNGLGLKFNDLVTIIMTMKKDLVLIKASLPKCPPDVITEGGKVIGAYCYYVDTNRVTFNKALSECRDLKGTLAEPLFLSSPSLYTALKEAFPSKFATIEKQTSPQTDGLIWIGAQTENVPTATEDNPSDILYYVTTGDKVWFPDGNILNTIDLPNRGALMDKGGKSWSVDDINIDDHDHSYVCQFATI